MVALTLPSVGMPCSAFTVTTVLLMIFCTVRKLKMWFTSFVSEIHMSEADLLWECIMIRNKVFQLPDWFMSSNVCQIIDYVSCGEWLICAFYCIISILCVFLYFLFNFLHCSTSQKLMLLGRCIPSILLFPFIFIVYLVYDFIININI